jgi:RNA polymerase sigma-70 factor (ECF subfamily)
MALRTAYSIVRDRDLAEDAVQEAFVRSFTAIQSFDLKRPFGPWLSRIVVNEAIRLSNRNQKGGQPAEIPDQVSPAIAIQHEVERAEVQRLLRKCAADLPPEMRALVTLKYYREMTDPEIAAVVDYPVGTVKSRLAKARSLLREACLACGLDLNLDS